MSKAMRHAESGFTLMQMAVVVAIVGITLGAVFSFMRTEDDRARILLTRQHEQAIAAALTDYAQRLSVLPCPGDPSAATIELIGTARAVCNTPALRVGVVPYYTLGLSPLDVLDAYGNPFTYAVQEDVVTNLGTVGNVYDTCRNADWIPGVTNLNPDKANLCCRQISANRLRVFSDLALTVDAVPAQSPTPQTLAPVDTGPSAVTGGNLAYIAYILVSHGKNALGVYQLGGAGRTTTVGANAAELENTTDDLNFAEAPFNTVSGPNYFDDIVLWRTQQHLLRDLGNDSCKMP